MDPSRLVGTDRSLAERIGDFALVKSFPSKVIVSIWANRADGSSLSNAVDAEPRESVAV